MHILILVLIGVAVLAVFVLAAAAINSTGRNIDGARLFIWAWLIVALVNGAFGVYRAGIPLINEIGAFIPIFGVPALFAWFLSRRFAAG